MKLIFSRKGFDSANGGVPSPILGGRPLSLPIPSRMPTPVTFGDLPDPVPALVDQLTRGRLTAKSHCHLDPDLDPAARPREPGWRGALGQVGAAQGHLSRQGIGPGDIFLFWGLFRAVDQGAAGWRFTGPTEHRLFGWLQVEEVVPLGADGTHAARRHPWLAEHPHVRPGWSDNNTLYLASTHLVLRNEESDLPGFGLFRRGSRLTAEDSRLPSQWDIPDWLNPKRGGVGMTYHPEERFTESGVLRTAARGQEFVADIADRQDALAWLRELLWGER